MATVPYSSLSCNVDNALIVEPFVLDTAEITPALDCIVPRLKAMLP